MDLKFKEFSKGSTATIYKKNDIILKKYDNSLYARYGIEEDVFNALKSINSSNLLKLIELYKENNEIYGYTYKYVKSDNINIVEEDASYTLDNLRNLEKLGVEFNKLNIIMNDTHSKNIIFQKDNMVIIDPDEYQVRCFPKEYLIVRNKVSILYYIKTAYLSCFKRYSEYYYKADSLFDFDINLNTDLTYELSKKLVNKKPIDIIKN